MIYFFAGSATYTTSSLSTKTTSASDPPNICKVKPQQLQSSGMSNSNFSQLGCVPSLLPQQQTPQVFVSQSAAGMGFTLFSQTYTSVCVYHTGKFTFYQACNHLPIFTFPVFKLLSCCPNLLCFSFFVIVLCICSLCVGSAAQIPAFYMDTSHLFSTPHPRLPPPSIAQQQGFQPGLSQVNPAYLDINISVLVLYTCWCARHPPQPELNTPDR